GWCARRRTWTHRTHGTRQPGSAQEHTIIDQADTTTTRKALLHRFPVFAHHNFRWFFSGQLVSITGTWMERLAQSWLVLTLTSSAFALGFVPVAQFLPTIIFTLAGGVLADRMPKRRLMLWTQSLSAILSFLLAALVLADAIALWHIYLFAFLLGTLNAIDAPARQSFVTELVGTRDTVQAVSLNAAAINTGRIVGPALAGGVLATVGAGWCFAVNGLSFLVVVATLLKMDPRQLYAGAPPKQRGSIRDGIAFAARHRLIATSLLAILIATIFGSNFAVWVPLLAKEVYATGAGGFGIFMSALGVGAVLGALCLATLGDRTPPGSRVPLQVALLGAILAGIGLVSTTAAPTWLAALLVAAFGFVLTFNSSLAASTIQLQAPGEMRGRVMSLYFLCTNGVVPIGAMLAGSLAQALGTPRMMIVSGGICTVLALVVFLRAARHSP
ncbi:MAG: MFS transporter, partial [Thermomicrobiales bacterium]